MIRFEIESCNGIKRVFGENYLYDHPAGDKEVGGGERRPEEGSHHELKNNAEIKMLNRFEFKSLNGIKSCFDTHAHTCACSCSFILIHISSTIIRLIPLHNSISKRIMILISALFSSSKCESSSKFHRGTPGWDPETPPGHHKDTTGTPGHYRDTTGTLPGHHRDTTGTPPGHQPGHGGASGRR